MERAAAAAAAARERPGLNWTLGRLPACLRGPQIHCRIIIREPIIGADERDRESHRTRVLLCITTRRYLFLPPPCCILITDQQQQHPMCAKPPTDLPKNSLRHVRSIYISALASAGGCVCGCFCQLFRPGFGLMRVKLPAENRNEVANLNCPVCVLLSAVCAWLTPRPRGKC
jgi:hypothetical protein